MIDISELQSAFKKIDDKLVIGSIADAGNAYIVYLTEPGLRNGEHITDTEYIYSVKDKSIRPFRASDDPKLYSRAMRHIVYIRPELRG